MVDVVLDSADPMVDPERHDGGQHRTITGESAPDDAIQVAEFSSLTEVAAAVDWQRRGVVTAIDDLVTVPLLWPLAHSGNCVLGAYQRGRLVGCAIAVLGLGADRQRQLYPLVSLVADIKRRHQVERRLADQRAGWARKRRIKLARRLPREVLGKVFEPVDRKVEVSVDDSVVTVWICELRTVEQIKAAAEILWVVWSAKDPQQSREVFSVDALWSLARSGNCVLGAHVWDEDQWKMVGCTVGALGMSEKGQDDWEVHLHSHIAGVLKQHRNKNIGYWLKIVQRDWSLRRGIDTIRWTFDPLSRRNAHFNLRKLGATAIGFEPDFYGRMQDGSNGGDFTDRLLVEWKLNSQQVDERIRGQKVDNTADLQFIGEERKYVEVPAHLDALAPDERLQHRFRVREEFEQFLGDGYRVIGINKDEKYVFAPPEPQLAAPGSVSSPE